MKIMGGVGGQGCLSGQNSSWSHSALFDPRFSRSHTRWCSVSPSRKMVLPPPCYALLHKVMEGPTQTRQLCYLQCTVFKAALVVTTADEQKAKRTEYKASVFKNRKLETEQSLLTSFWWELSLGVTSSQGVVSGKCSFYLELVRSQEEGEKA